MPLDSLHADAGYLIGRVLDKSLTADDVVSIIRSRIDEARAALAAPAHPATAGDADLIEALLDAADEWANYVDVDRAPMTLRKYLEQAMRASKGGE
ncbi:hypothetical protein [Imbroritus primus]|uniref:hypothetical protein n=1 Tax=Imbroritus primus TaxID=3058603 RepID=UPI003D1606EA